MNLRTAVMKLRARFRRDRIPVTMRTDRSAVAAGVPSIGEFI
jgi:hypothetical protein